MFAQAGLDRIPLFVKAGSILPMAQPLQHTGELAETEVEYHVYPGADAEFQLYSDDGDGYGYETGGYTVKNLSWDDAKRELWDGEGQTIQAALHQ